MKNILRKTAVLFTATTLLFSCASCTKSNDETTEVQSTQNDATREFMGVVEDGTYYNNFAGFKVSFDDVWEFYNEEEIAELSGFAVDMLSEDYQKLIEASGTVYTLFANNPETAASVNVTAVRNVTEITSDMLMEMQSEQLRGAYEEMGAESVEINSGMLALGEKEVPSIDTKCGIYGMDMYQNIVLFDCDDYLFVLTITSLDSNEIQKITEGIALI